MRRLLRPLAGLAVGLLAAEVAVRLLVFAPGVTERMLRVQWADTAAQLHWYRGWLVAWSRSRSPDSGGTWEDTAFDPLLGWVPRAGFADIDARGLRDAGLPRSEGARRVVVVGDSFAFGSDVRVDEAWHGVLEARRPDLDMMVLAGPGYGLDQVTLRTERDAPALQPEVVLLPGIGIDIPRALTGFISYAKPRFTLEAGELVLHGPPLPGPHEMLRHVALRPRLVDLATVLAERQAWHNVLEGPRGAEAFAINEALLDRWARAVREMGALPVFVALPTPHELAQLRDGRTQSADELARHFFARWCARQDFPCLDRVGEVMDQTPDLQTVGQTGHWTVSGNVVVADVVEQVLVDLALLPPTPPP